MDLCYFLNYQLPEDALHCTVVSVLGAALPSLMFVGSQQAHSEESASPATTRGREGWSWKKKHVLAVQLT